MAHFFIDGSLRAETAVPGAVLSIDGAEARHAVTVSRVRAGERLRIGNGAGLMLEVTVTGADGSRLTFRVDEAAAAKPGTPRILLVQALAKGDRDEMAVQAATELGIDGVIPWAASRSVTRWEGPKVVKGQSRWASIVREASKQSIRAWLPEVAGLTSTGQLAAMAAGTRMFLLEPTAELRLTEMGAPTDDRDLLLVVGPEGGITPAELDQLEQAGATRVRLGETVLRTSTAGPAALAILNAALGRW